MKGTFESEEETPTGKPAGCRWGFVIVSKTELPRRKVYWSPNNKKGSECKNEDFFRCICGKREVTGKSEFVLITGLSEKNVIRYSFFYKKQYLSPRYFMKSLFVGRAFQINAKLIKYLVTFS